MGVYDGGYHGFSRSNRSKEAIENFEVPKSLITKDLINDFLESGDYTVKEKNILKNFSAAKWKHAAEMVEPSSWHHTSSHYNETNHYDLLDIAFKILENPEAIEQSYQRAKKVSEKDQDNIKYGVINVEIWGGTRKHPTIVDHHTVAGIIKENWLYYKDNTIGDTWLGYQDKDVLHTKTKVTVFDPEVLENRKNTVLANLSSYEGKDNEGNAKYSSWRSYFVGKAFEKAKDLQSKMTIELKEAKIENHYDKEKKTLYVNLTVFDFDVVDKEKE